MDVKSIKEVCRVLGDELAFEANIIFTDTGEQHNEKQMIADMLNDIAEYVHKK